MQPKRLSLCCGRPGMTSRSVAYETARLRLSRYRIQGREGRLRAAMHATQVSAEALAADRAGVWLFAARKAELSCFVEYESASQSHGVSDGIDRGALSRLRSGAGRRAACSWSTTCCTHPATRELAPLYLAPRGVSAVLDAPILRDGRVIGVGTPRAPGRRAAGGTSATWTSRARSPTWSTLIFEQAERLELEAALQDQAEQRQESQKMEALGRMASAIVHDFNNVLGAVAMATELAASEKPDMRALGGAAAQIVDDRPAPDRTAAFVRQAMRNEPSGTCELGRGHRGHDADAARGGRRTRRPCPSDGGGRCGGRDRPLAGRAAAAQSRAEFARRDQLRAGRSRSSVRDAVAADDAPPQSMVLSA